MAMSSIACIASCTPIACSLNAIAGCAAAAAVAGADRASAAGASAANAGAASGADGLDSLVRASISSARSHDSLLSAQVAAPWAPDQGAHACALCTAPFAPRALRRKHHCRLCGQVVCAECSCARLVANGYDERGPTLSRMKLRPALSLEVRRAHATAGVRPLRGRARPRARRARGHARRARARACRRRG